MRQAGAKQIAFVVQKNLCFVDQAAKRGGMHDAVAVALKQIARRCFGFGKTPSATL